MNKQQKDWKDNLKMVYSTNSDYEPEEDSKKQETLPAEKQQLRVWIDRKGRKGKTATLVKDFVGSEDDLKDLAKLLKSKCGTGGSVKEGEIIIQGDMQSKVTELLISFGYPTKKAGG